MGVLMGLLAPLRLFNDTVLAACRVLGMLALAIMVIFILIQVFSRYILNDALPWSEEAARFCMLWMTGLVAPASFRRGGFVVIDMLERALPRLFATILSMTLLLIAVLVMVYALQIGWAEVTGFAGTFKTASLYTYILPSISDLSIEFGLAKMPRSHMMASLVVGLTLMIIVSAELLIRSIITLVGGGDDLPPLAEPNVAGAE
ncbi:TRAP transporter small permease [Actibacterium sp. 188UL27-1]|uniref:TRAP transporter small permease n=1 Tax=Actibacterium sp. 188UL27-1 TaxID=2786961 RepID=UPI00195631D6|nr:TRAP transporter small permease subunit [Actibacterium sp. 188UL27-1]MBM7068434.1 TRAP transporter small permease subunit [Actibacterium sp. 188UL27-1]